MNILSAKEFQGVVNSVPRKIESFLCSNSRHNCRWSPLTRALMPKWSGLEDSGLEEKKWSGLEDSSLRGVQEGKQEGREPVDQIGSCRLMQFIFLL